jgi:hypothetical protein
VCDLDMMGAPSKLSVIRKAAALARARPTLMAIPKVHCNLFFLSEEWRNPDGNLRKLQIPLSQS